MKNTANLNLKKPDQTDYVNISDLNDNMDVIDEVIQKKYEKPPAGIPKIDLAESVQAALDKANTALQSVTKDSIGLENVDNTSDLDKPISNAMQNALDGFKDGIKLHTDDLSHVHWIDEVTGVNSLVATDATITELKEGLGISFKNTTSSTGATTLNINNLGAIPILKANGNPVTNLKGNGVYTLRYSGGNFTLQGEGGEYGTAVASDVLAGKTFGTENGLVEGTATIASLGGKKWARGGKAGNGTNTTIISTNANFTIRLLILTWSVGEYVYRMVWDKNNNPSRSGWYLGDHLTYATPEGITGSNQYPNAITVSGNTISLSCGFVGSATVYWEVFE